MRSQMAVKVRRERPDQRRHHRVTAPLFIDFGGERYRADNWSLGGLKVSGLKGELPAPGDKIELQLTLPFQGFGINFQVNCEVVRNDADEAMVAVKYLDLGEREAEVMQHFIEDIIRGAMTDVEDTIQRIDVPVTPASLKPDVNPANEVPVRRWPIKTIMMSAFYIMMGFGVFGYTAYLVFANYFNLEIRSAVIAAPLENVKAQAEGRVQWTRFQPGDHISEGDIVLRLLDNKVEHEIDLARLQIKERNNEIAYLMRRKVDELEKVSAFADLEAKDIAQARLNHETLKEDVHAARLHHVRTEHLFERGHAPAVKREDARRRLSDLERKLERQKLDLQTRIRLAEKNLGKRHFTGRDMIGDLQRVSAEIRRAEGLLALDKERFEIAKQHRARLAVRAPFEGTLLRLPRVHNGHVKAGETIAIIEKSGERTITAFLTQQEILDIEIGKKVDVYIPSTGEVVAARVVNVDRTMGFFKQASERSPVRLQWRESKERTAMVTLNFEDANLIVKDPRYRSGLPVTVNFTRKTGSYVTAAISRRLRQAWYLLPDSESFSIDFAKIWMDYKQSSEQLAEGMRRDLGKPPAGVPRPKPAVPSSRLESMSKGFRIRPDQTAAPAQQQQPASAQSTDL